MSGSIGSLVGARVYDGGGDDPVLELHGTNGKVLVQVSEGMSRALEDTVAALRGDG